MRWMKLELIIQSEVREEQILDWVGEGKGGMIWETSIEACTLPHVEQMTSASLMHEAGHPKPAPGDNPEGWGGEGRGRGVQDGGDTRTPGFMLVDGKDHHSVVK